MGSTKSKADLLQALKIGNGIQYLLNEACKILGNPILTHDMDYKTIAYTENIVTDEPIWNEFVTTGMVGYDRLLFYKDECFFEAAANAKKITFLLSDKLKYDRIFGKLFTKNSIQIGCACMVACYKPFEDDTPELFEIFCDILSKEFCKSKFYQNYGQAYMETLLTQLIEKRIIDADLYTAQIESVYIGFDSILRVAIADISQFDPEYTKLEYFRDLFKHARPDYKYAIYSQYIVIIMSSKKEIFDAKEALNKLNTLFNQRNIYVGISSGFENLFELQKYYAEAVNALHDGFKSESPQRVFLYGTTK